MFDLRQFKPGFEMDQDAYFVSGKPNQQTDLTCKVDTSFIQACVFYK